MFGERLAHMGFTEARVYLRGAGRSVIENPPNRRQRLILLREPGAHGSAQVMQAYIRNIRGLTDAVPRLADVDQRLTR